MDISLDNQVNVFSVDTSAFYTDKEKAIQKEIYQLNFEESVLSELLRSSSEANEKRFIETYISELRKNKKARSKKVYDLKAEFGNELESFNGIRNFRCEQLKDSNVISVFESSLTRTIGFETNKTYDSMIIVRVFYYQILRDLMINGFTLNGEKFRFFTASAGQIRTKKAVFIKESLWLQHRATLMCGLTPEIIEKKGGINRNKYLAYLALCNSATDPWPRFNIRKSIVVDDMETAVHGLVDYLDDKTFDITRREMDVNLTHTDGCGMVLPRVCKRNVIFRAPWIKGLLSPFAFDKFIKEANAADPSVNHALVRDIYGKTHDLLAEDIEIIFTKTMTKLWKFYDGWDDYIDKYEKNGCSAGICNMEETHIPNAKLNYQVLQSLNEMSDSEVEQLSQKSATKIKELATTYKGKLCALGANKENTMITDFQKCLLLYPELLTTSYVRDLLMDIKKSLIKEGRSGRLNADAKYLFIVPDLYAFCEWLFLGDKNPKGLLADGEVFCSQYARAEKLDCLRSPSLYREHAVRRNTSSAMLSKWFTTAGIYTSCHDLISKLLMFDKQYCQTI